MIICILLLLLFTRTSHVQFPCNAPPPSRWTPSNPHPVQLVRFFVPNGIKCMGESWSVQLHSLYRKEEQEKEELKDAAKCQRIGLKASSPGVSDSN